MHTRRVLSHFTVALFLVALVSLHVTSAYPIHDPPLVHRPKDKEASPGPSTTSTSYVQPPHVHEESNESGVDIEEQKSPPPDHELCFFNAEGQRKRMVGNSPGEMIWEPAPGDTPLKIKRKWLNFEIGHPPELKPSHDPEIRALIVAQIKHYCTELKDWVESGTWMTKYQIYTSQVTLADQLLELTRFDLEEAPSSGLEGCKPLIRNRMLMVLHMQQTPLTWGSPTVQIQKRIELTLRKFARIMSRLDERYNPLRDTRFQNIDVLTRQVKLDLVNEENQRTADIHTHS
ncbi:hypothetical protein H0H93_006545 [Arthromyces matolae]|nr:hypothetical protein H0H93_006545 [Arthromyces matolae]